MQNVAMSAHRSAWKRLVENASNDRYAKYGVYATRILAVKHPEVYLIGDALFHRGLALKGWKESYDEPSPLSELQMEYGSLFSDEMERFYEAEEKGEPYVAWKGIPHGHPLLLTELPLHKYRLTETCRIYPDPYSPFLDQRMAPLAVSLKTEGKAVTQLELAEMYYFRAKELGANTKSLFLMYCAGEDAYVVDGDELFSVQTARPIENPSTEPVLIFNEESVWYPLMERDDRKRDQRLSEVVDRFAKLGAALPPHNDWEASMVQRLEQVSTLANEKERCVAGLAAARGLGWTFHPFVEAWNTIVPETNITTSISRHMCLVREFDRHANSVSPAAAYLYGVMGKDGSLLDRVRRLGKAYLLSTGLLREKPMRGWKPKRRLESWGHIWVCGLMEHTLDGAFRTRGGHCVSQSHMISAPLELVGIPTVVVMLDRGEERRGANHHVMLSQDGQFLIDDGIVNFKGIDWPTEEYTALLSFSMEGKWASTVEDALYGNVTSSELSELIERVDSAIAGRFKLQFFDSRTSPGIVSKQEFLDFLKHHEVEQVGLP